MIAATLGLGLPLKSTYTERHKEMRQQPNSQCSPPRPLQYINSSQLLITDLHSAPKNAWCSSIANEPVLPLLAARHPSISASLSHHAFPCHLWVRPSSLLISHRINLLSICSLPQSISLPSLARVSMTTDSAPARNSFKHVKSQRVTNVGSDNLCALMFYRSSLFSKTYELYLCSRVLTNNYCCVGLLFKGLF